ncbi:MAG: hypothetical protein AAB316_12810 [Bacteroidota bacterium]
MKNKLSTFAVACAALSIFLFCNCRKTNLEAFVKKLPELPQDIAATLDTNTMATKIPIAFAPPERDPNVSAVPCCDIKIIKSLKVTFTYTKCRPLQANIPDHVIDLFLANPGQGGGQEAGERNFKLWKLTPSKHKTAFKLMVCETSQGPWNANLEEKRACSHPAPVHTLTINAFEDIVQFVWNGGIGNHPPDVGLVSCRLVSDTRFLCPGGLSTCDCTSSFCPAEQACLCNLEGQW